MEGNSFIGIRYVNSNSLNLLGKENEGISLHPLFRLQTSLKLRFERAIMASFKKGAL
jgi:hypothetical protein